MCSHDLFKFRMLRCSFVGKMANGHVQPLFCFRLLVNIYTVEQTKAPTGQTLWSAIPTMRLPSTWMHAMLPHQRQHGASSASPCMIDLMQSCACPCTCPEGNMFSLKRVARPKLTQKRSKRKASWRHTLVSQGREPPRLELLVPFRSKPIEI